MNKSSKISQWWNHQPLTTSRGLAPWRQNCRAPGIGEGSGPSSPRTPWDAPTGHRCPLRGSRWTAAIPPCFGHIDSPEHPRCAGLPGRQHLSNALRRHELPLTELVELLRWDPSYANRNSYIIIHCNCKYPECFRYGFNIHFLWIAVGETNLVLKVYNGKHLRIGSSDRWDALKLTGELDLAKRC